MTRNRGHPSLAREPGSALVGACAGCETGAWGVIPVVVYPFKGRARRWSEGRGWWYGCAYPRFLGIRTAAVSKNILSVVVVISLASVHLSFHRRIFLYVHARAKWETGKHNSFFRPRSLGHRSVTSTGWWCHKSKHDGVHMTKSEQM